MKQFGSSKQQLLFYILRTRWPWRLLICVSSAGATLVGLAGPFFQQRYLDALLNGPGMEGTRLSVLHSFFDSSTPALLLVVYSFFCVLGYLGLSLLTNFLGAREAIIMQGLLGQKLYEKTLILRPDSLAGRPIGEFVSTYATDVPGATIFLEQTLPQGANIIFPLILVPIVLTKVFHVPLTSVLIIMGSITSLNFMLAYRQSRYFLQFKVLAAQRIGVVVEWIQNLRTLRILGWVEDFEKRIYKKRLDETRNRVTMVTNGQVMNSFASSITFILNIAVIMALATQTTEPLTSGTLFAILWIVGVFLTRPFRQMPWVFTFVFDGWTSISRLVEYLNLSNIHHFDALSSIQKIPELKSNEPILQIQNLNLTIGTKEILKCIDLAIKPGEFVAIVGEVGSGKTQLLLSLMGETGAKFEKYRLHAADAIAMPSEQLRQFFCFVPQEGFIMSATLRENVAFDYDATPNEDPRILQSLRNAQFDLTTERISEGLDTEIGERGVNLSGGQKQRVSLSRVDYYSAPIILIDDGLSAVDVETEDKLIESLLKGSWKNRTRILVTHRLTVLDEVDRIIFLENGRIQCEGTLAQMLKTQPKFQKFATTIANPTNPEAVITQPLIVSPSAAEEGQDG